MDDRVDLLTGTLGVGEAHAGALGWCLAFAGYLVLPVSVAVVAAAVYASQTRTLNEEELDADTRRLEEVLSWCGFVSAIP